MFGFVLSIVCPVPISHDVLLSSVSVTYPAWCDRANMSADRWSQVSVHVWSGLCPVSPTHTRRLSGRCGVWWHRSTVCTWVTYHSFSMHARMYAGTQPCTHSGTHSGMHSGTHSGTQTLRDPLRYILRHSLFNMCHLKCYNDVQHCNTQLLYYLTAHAIYPMSHAGWCHVPSCTLGVVVPVTTTPRTTVTTPPPCPNVIPNGQLAPTCVHHNGHTCQYTCNTGFIRAMSHVTCLDNGQWDPNPACQGK
jgi:hypothetical protein